MKNNAYVYAKGNHLYVIIELSNGKKVDMAIKQVSYNKKLQYLICNNVDNLMPFEKKDVVDNVEKSAK